MVHTLSVSAPPRTPKALQAQKGLMLTLYRRHLKNNSSLPARAYSDERYYRGCKCPM